MARRSGITELVLDQPFYRKLSIKPILERLNSPDLDPEIRIKATTQMGMSGPETLLVGLRKTLRFDLKEAAVLDGRKVWKFHGTWKNRQGLVLRHRPVGPMGALPPYIPMDAIVPGNRRCWPYELILDRAGAAADLTDTRRLGPDGTPDRLEELDRKNPPQRDHAHLFGRQAERDDPPRRIRVSSPGQRQRLRRHRIARENARSCARNAVPRRKRLTPPSKDGDLLDQPIDVPVPGADPGRIEAAREMTRQIVL